MVALFFAITIFINEVMPAPSNAPEWVELYNPGTEAIDVSGWYLDDDTLGGTQILVPHGTHIPAGGLHVVVFSSAILNNTGDSVTLYDTNGQLVDRIDFGSMKSTESMARIPDGSTIIIKTSPSPGQSNATVVPTALPHTATSTTAATIEPTHTPAVAPSQTVTPSEIPTTPPTHTLSTTHTPSPTQTPSDTHTPSPTKTPSDTRTPTPTKTPSDTRTPSPTKTPSDTRTPSPTKTPSHTPLVSFTRTPSFTRTASTTKTPSHTRTLRPSKTPRPSHTPKSTQTPKPSKTPRPSRTADPHRVTTQHEGRGGSEPPATTPILGISGSADTPRIVVCPPAPSTLNNWALTATGHQITLPDSTECVTIELPADPPALWHLTNPHGLVVTTIDVFAQYCAHDISDCQPSPTMPHMAIHVDYQRPLGTSIVATRTPDRIDRSDASAMPPPKSAPSTTSPSTIPLGMLLMLGGWMALKLLARPTSDVLYSETDEDAASSADPLSSESRKV